MGSSLGLLLCLTEVLTLPAPRHPTETELWHSHLMNCHTGVKHLECPFFVSWGRGKPGARAATSNWSCVASCHLVTLGLPPDVRSCPVGRDRCISFLLEAWKPSEQGKSANEPDLHASSPDSPPFPAAKELANESLASAFPHLFWQHLQPFLMVSNASSRHAFFRYWLPSCRFNHQASP